MKLDETLDAHGQFWAQFQNCIVRIFRIRHVSGKTGVNRRV